MRELFKPTPEITYELPGIHEAGGFGKNGWRMLTEFPNATTDNLSKDVLKYGEAVLEGIIVDTRFAHREYLSRHDWFNVENTARLARFAKQRADNFMKSPFTISKEIDMQLYANLEAERAYTIDDHKKEIALYRDTDKYNFVPIGETHTMWRPVFFTLPSVAKREKVPLALQLQDIYAHHFDGVKPYVAWRGVQAYIFPSGDFDLPEDATLFAVGEYLDRKKLPERTPAPKKIQDIY